MRFNIQTFNIEIIEGFRKRVMNEANSLTMASLFKLMYIFSRSRNYHMAEMIGPLLYENSELAEPTDSTDLTPEMISSAIGSFFKSKFSDPNILSIF